MMDFQMREALRKSRIFLIENVVFEPLCDHLIDQDIFSNSMLENIKAKEETAERMRRTIDHLTKRPNSCFEKFLNALTNSGHEHCAQKVKENYVRSGPTQVSDANPDPTMMSNPAALRTSMPSGNYSAAPVGVAPAAPLNNSLFVQAGSQLSSAPMAVNLTSTGNRSFTSSQKQPQYFGFPEISESSFGAMASPVVPLSTPVQESYSMQEQMTPASNLPPHEVVRSQMEKLSVGGHGDFQLRQSIYERLYQHDPTKVYRMESVPRGLALVISNENFEFMSDRNGSDVDMKNLHAMFKHLGFDVCHQVDKTAAEMKSLMQDFAQYRVLENVDSLAVVIMSHGGQDGVIYGIDGCNRHCSNEHSYITDETIRDIFSAKNCPLMANKPKLIIIQACRGRNEDTLLPDAPVSSPPLSCNNQPIGTDGGSIASSTTSTSSTRAASMSNMLLLHSTVHGFVSYRHPVNGSPFIKALRDVFKEQAMTEHVLDMTTEVCSRVSHMHLQQNLRTTPPTTTLLTKKWYLNPLRSL